MADLRGLFSNNRRREVNGVTGVLPYSIADADIREGTVEVVLGNEASTLVTIPAGCLITEAYAVVETGSEFVAGEAIVSIGSVAEVIGVAITPIDLTTAGVTSPEAVLPIITEADTDVVVTTTAVTVDAGNAKAQLRVVLAYTDYKRATMSYIGED